MSSTPFIAAERFFDRKCGAMPCRSEPMRKRTGCGLQAGMAPIRSMKQGILEPSFSFVEPMKAPTVQELPAGRCLGELVIKGPGQIDGTR